MEYAISTALPLTISLAVLGAISFLCALLLRYKWLRRWHWTAPRLTALTLAILVAFHVVSYMAIHVTEDVSIAEPWGVLFMPLVAADFLLIEPEGDVIAAVESRVFATNVRPGLHREEVEQWAQRTFGKVAGDDRDEQPRMPVPRTSVPDLPPEQFEAWNRTFGRTSSQDSVETVRYETVTKICENAGDRYTIVYSGDLVVSVEKGNYMGGCGL